MANQDYIDILKQGVEQWNVWRKHHQEDILLDMRRANLIDADLIEIDFSEVNLSGANLSGANLSGANLSGANLRGANLRDINLCNANLNNTNLREANLRRANLQNANLQDAGLYATYLHSTNLANTNLRHATILQTIFVDVDLSKTKGLGEVKYQGASFVQLHTVRLPQDGSALHFLRGTGIPETWIMLYRSEMMQPIEYHSLFISYSSKDEALARRLHADLQDNGVRCWFAPEDMKIGDKIRARIDEAIYQQEKLLLLLSEHALTSSWIEDEVEAALEKERRQQREVLFPVRLDDNIMQTEQAWAAKLRRTRHIGDFTNWTDPQAYQIALDRLLRDLKRADE